MAKQYSFGKKERLKSRKLIEQLFSKGQRFGIFPYRVFYMFNQNAAHPGENRLQCGVGVTTRNFKKATDRNRIKRLTREAWRLQKMELDRQMADHPQHMVLFLIYTGKELPAFTVVKEKVALIIEKLSTIAHENSTPGS